jgi:predicted transcriptional regulator
MAGPRVRPALLATGVFVALLTIHVAASWAERRGWIYYRSDRGKGRGVALSNALAEFEVLLNPAAEHRIEEERSQQVIAIENGQELLGLGDPEHR